MCKDWFKKAPINWEHHNKVALLFGKNNTHYGSNKLSFCVNDIDFASRTLIPYGFQMRYFADSDVTCKNFRNQLTYAFTNAVAGDVYGKDLGNKDVQERWASTWDDDTRGPRNGCVRAYGCNNHLEDIATMVEAVYALGPSDDFFKKLIKEDPRYKQKLDTISLVKRDTKWP